MTVRGGRELKHCPVPLPLGSIVV